MPFNINTFRANGLPGAAARPSLFLVRFPTAPPGVLNGNGNLEYLISSASLPPSIVDKVPVYYFGRQIKFSGERIFPDWDITVYCDEDFVARDFFESWSNKMNTLISNRYDLTSTMTSYKLDSVEVKQYSKAGPPDEGGIIKSYTFWGMWPSVVGPMVLSWDRGNQIHTFDVTLSYDYWLPDTFGTTGAYQPDLDSTSAYPNIVSQIVPTGSV